jgi:hypothetical protein
MLAAVRCICDTAGQEYYWLALLIPVAAWECLENRPPIGAFLVVIAVWSLYAAVANVSSTILYGLAVLTEAALLVFLARRGADQSQAPGGLKVEPPHVVQAA